MKRALIVISLLLLLATAVSAREYCCLGPYYCEGFTSLVDARAGCFGGFSDFASSYSCSHRVNHDFCQSCCEINGERFTVFTKNQCEDGVFFFQQDCSDIVSRGRIFGVVSAPGTLDSVVVQAGEASGLTLPDGRFSIPIPATGSISMTASDPKGRYTSASKTVSVSSMTDDVDAGSFSLSAVPRGSPHTGPTSGTLLEGFVRRDGWPLSLYTVSNGGTTKTTMPNGYFRFPGSGGELTISGNGLASPQTVSPTIVEGGSTFIDVACNEVQCNIVASTTTGTIWNPDDDDDDDSDILVYVGYFLPGPPGTPNKPGEEEFCVVDDDCPAGQACNGGVCGTPTCSHACAVDAHECVGDRIRTCIDGAQCREWGLATECAGEKYCDPATGACVSSPSACKEDDDCEDGNTCTSNPCIADACQFSYKTEGTACTLGPKSGTCDGDGLCRVEDGVCIDDADCIGGQVCIAGTCSDSGETGCGSDADCADGEVCVSGACEPEAEEDDGYEPAACATILTCYDYDDKAACADKAIGDPCGVSSYGCEWVSVPAHIDGGFCKPVDGLEAPVMTPCEECEAYYSECTEGACESFGGICTFVEPAVFFNDRMTRCVPDEVRACGAEDCVVDLRKEVRANPPDEPTGKTTVTDLDVTDELEEDDEGVCIGALCGFRTDDDPHPVSASNIVFWLSILLVVVVGGILLFFVYRSNPDAFKSAWKRTAGSVRGLIGKVERKDGKPAAQPAAQSQSRLQQPSSAQRAVSSAPRQQSRGATREQQLAQRQYQQRYQQYQQYRQRTIQAQQQAKPADPLHKEVFDDLDRLIASDEKKTEKKRKK